MRARLLQEILDTEKSYVGGLTTLHQQYQLPVQKSPESVGMTKEEAAILFSGIEAMLQLNLRLLGELHGRLAWRDAKEGDGAAAGGERGLPGVCALD